MTTSFRTDIQALRAVAVLFVVAYHVWPNHIRGGYIGVDVFFVISGYLITAHLLREVASTGRINLRRFYARRARRLLPASCLTIVGVGLASYLWMPPLTWSVTAFDIAASALYAQNWALVHRSVDYLAQDQAPSPLQHFWSLAVEEQFYVVWPLVMAGVGAFWKRRRTARAGDVCDSCRHAQPQPPPPSHTVYAVPMGALCALSFAAALHVAYSNPAPGYFMTHVRLHELGAGGLLALWVPGGGACAATDDFGMPHAVDTHVPLWSGLCYALSMAAGLSVIAATGFLYTPRLPFPGVAALLPVIGTAAANPRPIIAAGGRRGIVGASSLITTQIIAHPWLQYVGDISYSLYLIHWPVVVIYPFATGKRVDASLADSALVLFMSWGLAHVSKRYWEDRFRAVAVNDAVLHHSNKRTSQVALVEHGTVVATSVANAQSKSNSAMGLAVISTAIALIVSGSLRCAVEFRPGGRYAIHGPPATTIVRNTLHPGAEAWVRDAPINNKVSVLTFDDIKPSVDIAAVDNGPTSSQTGRLCMSSPAASEVVRCPRNADVGLNSSWAGLQPPTGKHHIILLGDSHAVHWLPALQAAAATANWTASSIAKQSCMPANATIGYRGVPYPACRTWTKNAVKWILMQRPSAVIFSSYARHRLHKLATADDQMALAAGVVDIAKEIAKANISVLAIKHTPVQSRHVPECLASGQRRGLDVNEAIALCSSRATDALNNSNTFVLAARQFPMMHMLDFEDAFCDINGTCPPVIGNVLVYRDRHHLTSTFSESLAPALRRRMIQALPWLAKHDV